MRPVKKILVEVNYKESAPPTLARALQFHQHQNVEITLFTCCYNGYIEMAHFFDTEQLEKIAHSITAHQEEQLRQIAQKYGLSDNEIGVKAVWQTPRYMALIEYAHSMGADLILTALHAPKSGSHWHMSSSDTQLLKASPIPTLFVKNPNNPANGTVMAALAPNHQLSEKSQLDEKVMNTAAQIAEHLSAPLHACHCFDPGVWQRLINDLSETSLPQEITSPEGPAPYTWLDDLREKAQEHFFAHCASHIQDKDHMHFIERDLIEGTQQLIADLNVSILVVGSAYRTGLLGSSAEALMRSIRCDLLVVKPAHFESPVLM